MEFHVGESVVYPNHGVAVVESIQELSVAGGSWPCYQLRILSSNTRVVVPQRNVKNIGLRRTIARREVAAVLGRVREGDAANGDWKVRFKENSDRMRSGRLADVVDVVGNLTRLASVHALSFREKQMLDKARELVLSEVAAAGELSPESAAAMLDEALAPIATG